jgi:hypothetical protein
MEMRKTYKTCSEEVEQILGLIAQMVGVKILFCRRKYSVKKLRN